jgi:2-polyprenyl-6-methoxyphenol hydroxylase-like FAD-dependent oxidoreductase
MNQLTDRADVVILGGGPAGLAAGIALRQKGMDCLIVEALSPVIDKGCGEGLMPDALESLRCLGIEISEADGHAFHGIRFCNTAHSVDAIFPAGTGIGVRRTKLHQLMIERAAEVGVRLAWNTHAKVSDKSLLSIGLLEQMGKAPQSVDGPVSTICGASNFASAFAATIR